MDISIIDYVRAISNQTAHEPHLHGLFRPYDYPRSLKQDIQINKINVTFKGWVWDPKLRYLVFVWTNNSAQGEQGQLAVGGFFAYKFNDLATLGAGVDSVPSTRSTTGNYPNWLRNDNRLMADEFFRGSFLGGPLAGRRIQQCSSTVSWSRTT